MGYADYLSRINQMNTEYPQDRKNAKYILNVLYNNKGVYKSKRYKDPIEGLIQVPCEKVDLREIFYQAVCRKIRKEMGFYIASVYLTIDKGFNCDLYITDIEERISQWTESSKNGLWTFYIQAE